MQILFIMHKNYPRYMRLCKSKTLRDYYEIFAMRNCIV